MRRSACATMLRRPRVGETEQDLLGFQEKFLASRETASTSLVAETVGGKRKQRPEERDVVSLTGGLPPARDDGGSSVKKSRFKEQMKEKSIPSQVLSDIQDRDVVERLVTMPTWMTSRGFPAVQSLDSNLPSPAATGKKKSLFALQCDSHSPEFFGFKPTNQTQPFGRDKVQPFDMNTEPSREAPPTTNESTQFASTASQAWTSLLGSDSAPCPAFSSPSLISGEGLVRSEVNWETAAEEVKKIHLENVERLREVSEAELRAERQRVERALGPELVAFLKTRSTRRERGEGVKERGEGMETEEGSRGEGERGETGVVATATWVHMDQVQRDKMEWMTDVLPTDLKEGGPVRFSMEGLIIPRGTSLPSHSALYHHGDEPAAAGYSLNELLSLVRSSVFQQRIWSLSTLAKILDKAWRGGYRGAVSHEVLGALCAAGLPLLLRHSVDDSSSSVISPAIAALHSLLVPTWEERLLGEMSGCHRGTSLPFTGTGQERREGGKERGQGEEEEDSEIMDRDIVLGYLATGLLRRLRYILEVVRPHPPEVLQTLQIITRMARHSLHAAAQVVECPRLMSAIFSEFLPLVWSPAEDGGSSLSYGIPQPAAMRLMQVLVSASRNLASLLLTRHGLLEVIVRYTVPHPSELSLPANSAHFLSVAALQTGRALLQYGFASTWISDCYQVLSRHFFSLASLSLTSLSLHTAVHLSAMVSLLEPALSLLPFSLVSSLLPPLLSGLARWVREADDEQETVTERLVCLRSALHVVASYLTSSSTSDSDVVGVSEVAASLSSPSGLIHSLSHSPLLRSALSGLSKTSPLLCSPLSSPSSPPPSSLPYLHPSLPLPPHPAIYGGCYDDDTNTLLHPRFVYISSTDFLLGYLRLCLAVGSAHKGVVSRVSQLLSNPQFRDYVALVCNSSPVKYPCTVFGEFQLLHTTVRLFMMKVAGGVSQEDVLLYHGLCLRLVSVLPPGMECVVNDLISSAVFHPSLLPELDGLPGSLLTQDLSSLSLLHPPQPLPSPLLAGHTPLSSLLAETRDRLPSISSTVLASLSASFFTQQALDCSRHLFHSTSRSPPLPSLCCPPYSAPLLPADWFALPLVSLYQHSLSRSCDPGSEVIVTVRNTLSVQLLLEKLRPTSLSHLPPSTRLSPTLLTFLIGNDLFLEREVRPLLSDLLTSVFCSQTFQQTLDLSLPAPGLPSFTDLYECLLTQYVAVSYGDPLFTAYLLLPLQRRFPVALRRSVWGRASHTLRLLSLPLDQLPVKVDFFLSPPETDHQMLDLYMGALSTGSVRSQWSPLMYLTAVHHMHHFLFPERAEEGGPEDCVFRERLLLVVQRMQNKETRGHILYYAGPSGESGLGFKTSDQQNS